MVRALEVTIGSGRPFSSFGPGLGAYPPTGYTLVGVPFDPVAVDARIESRFDAVAGVRAAGRGAGPRRPPDRPSRTARQALGYRELLAHVETGRPLEDCVVDALRRTRAFARPHSPE